MMYKSGHGPVRMFFFHVQALVGYNILTLAQTYLLIVQRVLLGLFLVRFGQSLAHVQHHHRPLGTRKGLRLWYSRSRKL